MKRKLIALATAGFLVFAFTGLCLAEPELSVTGWFRVRSYWVPNIALDKTSTRERTYTDQRLILDPVLKISDAVQIKGRLRVLDYIWGYNTMPGWNFGQQIDETGARNPADPSNITWDRAWAVISLGNTDSFRLGAWIAGAPPNLLSPSMTRGPDIIILHQQSRCQNQLGASCSRVSSTTKGLKEILTIRLVLAF